MTARTKPPFRADHVGSLIRTPELVEARVKRVNGDIGEAELHPFRIGLLAGG